MHGTAVSLQVGISDDLEMFTPEVQGAGSGSGCATPEGKVGGPRVGNDARCMRVGVDEFVRGRNTRPNRGGPSPPYLRSQMRFRRHG